MGFCFKDHPLLLDVIRPSIYSFPTFLHEKEHNYSLEVTLLIAAVSVL